jgi:hypothetical protein
MGKYLSYTHLLTPSGSIYPSGSSQQYRVTPKNYVGMGVVSSTVTATADTEPTIMTTVSVSSITPTAITLTWTNVTSDAACGRDAVTFYSVEWDQGSSNWVALNSESEGFYLTYTHSPGGIFTPNTNFNYRVRAKNGVGYGPYSTVVTALSDT